MSIEKLLIANRGEIAVRVIQTCQRLGIETAIVYTEADAGSLPVQMADHSFFLSSGNTAYLDIEAIVAAALMLNVDAIHPGFGFLSENCDFSRRCNEEGIIFIGPSAHAIEVMGSKIEAKKLLLDHYNGVVPVIPGYNGDDQSVPTLIKEANNVGFPVLLKASAGGGGKGMRVVWEEQNLELSINSAMREAKDSFGDSKLLIERYFPTVRHVEIQVLGDSYGNVVHLFERDCSIQRRHQKIIEETPSPVLSEQLRNKMGEAAVLIAKAINYENAGTVEFILDENDKFYFLEMNTRLQVEHPITEAITGLDLVEKQIRISEGFSLEQLGIEQNTLQRKGHAMECRLYAEDPCNNFLPSIGKLLEFTLPDIEGVRYDSGVQTGSDITIYFDPMIAKIVSYGENRDVARKRMIKALKQLSIVGLVTNRAFLLQVLNHPNFKLGKYTTRFIENHLPIEERLLAISSDVENDIAIVSTIFLWWYNTQNQFLNRHVTTCFRNQIARWNFKNLNVNERDIRVEYLPKKPSHSHINQTQYVQSFTTRLDENPDTDSTTTLNYVINNGQKSDSIRCIIDCVIAGYGRSYNVYYLLREDRLFIQSITISRTIPVKILPRLPFEQGSAELTEGLYKSPMAGTVYKIMVGVGDYVENGQVLVILESMKMEHAINSNEDGEVEEVFISDGMVLQDGQNMIKIKKLE
eukprot:TRINITY_DN9554_c0_g1_i1.p1 TRINITY_DN9554_c0_g1~~TRINITY_DN9554_c0_g1_i1.p1  ORF type:complete len:693 (-),score=149.10 TRINITY_DN9554_c0_g1_i1:19-2097(-)